MRQRRFRRAFAVHDGTDRVAVGRHQQKRQNDAVLDDLACGGHAGAVDGVAILHVAVPKIKLEPAERDFAVDRGKQQRQFVSIRLLAKSRGFGRTQCTCLRTRRRSNRHIPPHSAHGASRKTRPIFLRIHSPSRFFQRTRRSPECFIPSPPFFADDVSIPRKNGRRFKRIFALDSTIVIEFIL